MRNLLFIILLLYCFPSLAQDTFSIVAIDTITGEIGSAGASCIDETAITGGAIIISDIIPGRGAIHTQSYWLSANQQNAHNRMLEGMSPQEIIDWLIENDAQNNPGRRQYGIVDLDSNGSSRSAAFTGVLCLDYKNHITGPNYAIQGNILLGQQILDSMESRFLNTQGILAEKLMAALQGANVPGADTRCMANGTSSLSAFIRVARPTDTTGNFYCDLNVPSVPAGMEPIDSLQVLFDNWLGTIVGLKEFEPGLRPVIYPNPASAILSVRVQQAPGGPQPSDAENLTGEVSLYNMLGVRMDQHSFDISREQTLRFNVEAYPPGIYILLARYPGQPVQVYKFSVR